MENQNQPEAGLPAILTSDKLLAIADQAEKRVDALNKIKLIALRTTNIRDWTDHGGKPWLQESGATKVGRLFGVSWPKPDDPVYEQFENGHFQYTYTIEFALADVCITQIGSRQSNDGFFNTRYKWDDNEGKKMSFDVPPSEIDKGDVKKAAYANCLERGVTTILGIKNLTWEEIEEHTEIKKDQVTSIQYGKDKKGKKPPPKPKKGPQETTSPDEEGVDTGNTEKDKILRAEFKSYNKADFDKYLEILKKHGAQSSEHIIAEFDDEKQKAVLRDLGNEIALA